MPARQLTTVAHLDDVPPDTVRTMRAGDVEVTLANVGGEIVALQAHCPHLGGPLGEGQLDGCVLSCPWHGWQFDVTTGENEFDRAITIATYDTLVENGEVKVALKELR